jgi:hypothetical protein
MISNCIELKNGFFIATRDINKDEDIVTFPIDNCPNRNDMNKYPETFEYMNYIETIPEFDFMFVIIKNKLLKENKKHQFFNNIEFLDDLKDHPLHFNNLNDIEYLKPYTNLYHLLSIERKKIGIIANIFHKIFHSLFKRKLNDETLFKLINWSYIIMKKYSYDNLLLPDINKFKISSYGLMLKQVNDDGTLVLRNTNNIIKKGEYIKINRKYYDDKLNYVYLNQLSMNNTNVIKISIELDINKSEAVKSVIQPLIEKFKHDSFYFTNDGASMNLLKYLRIISMNDSDISKLYNPTFFNDFVSLNNEYSIVKYLIQTLNILKQLYNSDVMNQINDLKYNNTINELWNSEYKIINNMEEKIKEYWVGFLQF